MNKSKSTKWPVTICSRSTKTKVEFFFCLLYMCLGTYFLVIAFVHFCVLFTHFTEKLTSVK